MSAPTLTTAAGLSDMDALNRSGLDMVASFDMIEEHWRDPTRLEAEREDMRRLCHNHFDAARDAGLRKAGLL